MPCLVPGHEAALSANGWSELEITLLGEAGVGDATAGKERRRGQGREHHLSASELHYICCSPFVSG